MPARLGRRVAHRGGAGAGGPSSLRRRPVRRLAGDAGLLVLGGAMGARTTTRLPLAAATRALMAEAVDQEVPTLGICLGASCRAGARRRGARGAAGPELGRRVDLGWPRRRDDPLFGVLLAVPRVVQWHWDDDRRAAAGRVCGAGRDPGGIPNQAFRVRRAPGVCRSTRRSPASIARPGAARATAETLRRADRPSTCATLVAEAISGCRGRACGHLAARRFARRWSPRLAARVA